MHSHARVALGLALGLGLVVVSSFYVVWWLVAPIGALVAAAAFLATFFVWSADRPEEGYEQVLFDAPNTMRAGALAALMVLTAFVGGHLLGPQAAPAAQRSMDAPALDRAHATLVDAYDRLLGALKTGDLDAHGSHDLEARVAAVQADLAALPPTDASSGLVKAAGALVVAIHAYDGCGDKAPCQKAALALLDAKAPLDAYAGGA